MRQVCYGRMCPSALVRVANTDVGAQVFGYRVDHPGLVDTQRTVTVNLEGWDRCLHCSDFDAATGSLKGLC
ncbi:MAG: hypothetical protein M1274_04540 [Actinobacteria bacterium]|nr:hypothetical protein [Actinomycetota bacterium]